MSGGPNSLASGRHLRGKRAAMVVFSYYPADPRPRRAAEALAREGMKVDLICLREADTDPKRETLNGVDIRRVPLRRRRGDTGGYLLQYGAFLLSAMGILAARSLTRRYDLAYVHNMPDVLVLSALVPKLLGAKIILDLHDPMPELMMTIFNLDRQSGRVRMLKRLERWSIRWADLALTVNLACKRLFASRSCRPEKIQVIMNSPDEVIFGFRPVVDTEGPTQPASDKPFVIMYHGSLVERNGLDLAVEALARVRRSGANVELRIYGSKSPFLERVMESVRSQGLAEAVHYLGPKRLEDIVGAIAECDVGVIPNQRSIFTELNTPTRIFEYLAVGKPVIAPRAAGILDYFDDDSLIFFELGDADDLARRIEHALAEPRKAAETARRGQDVYRAHAWRQEREVLVRLVDDLLSPRGSAR
jgi:glycosyltransferase involved in cell wall biosynthesis